MPRKNYTVYHPNKVAEHHLNQEEWSLEKLQKTVGGYIEFVPPSLWPKSLQEALKEKDLEVYCDEEGRFKDYAPNPHFYSVVGTVVVVEDA